MKIINKSLLFTCFCFLFVAACSGDGDGHTDEGSSQSSGQISDSSSPEELGKALVGVYHRAILETATLLKDEPEVEAVKATFAENKEGYIQELVKIGHVFAKLSPADRSTVERAVSSFQSDLQYDETLKVEYMDYYNASLKYSSKDQQFYDGLRDINIITQYAFFDLLKKQEPEEAKRLGIE